MKLIRHSRNTRHSHGLLGQFHTAMINQMYNIVGRPLKLELDGKLYISIHSNLAPIGEIKTDLK